MKVGVKTQLAAILVICSLLSLSGLAVAQTNVRITVVDTTNNIEAGGNVTFTFTVENLAAQQLTYDLFASGYPAGWLADFSQDQITLNASGQPEDNETIVLTITAPEDVDPGTTVNVVVEASQTTNRANTDSATFTAIVGSTFEVRIVMDLLQTDAGDVTQGDTCRYGFYIWNKGSAQDTIDLTLQNFPSGFGFSFGGMEYDLVLGAHKGTHINLDVDVPLTASLGADSFTLKAMSQSDSSAIDTESLSLTIVANATAGDIDILEASINPNPDVASFEAGEKTSFQIPVKSSYNVVRTVTMWWSISINYWNASTSKMESWNYDSDSVPGGVGGPGIPDGGGADPFGDPMRSDLDPDMPSQYGRWMCGYTFVEQNQFSGNNITVNKPTQTALIQGGQTKTFTFYVSVPGNAFSGDKATITVKATVLADISKFDSATFGAKGEGEEPAEPDVVVPALDMTTLLLGIGAIVIVIVIAAVAVGAGSSSSGGSTSRSGRKRRR